MVVERNNKNKIAAFSRRALSLRSGFIYGLFALLLAVALTGGMTSAWFTSGDQTENIFKAGTLDVEVDDLIFSSGTSLINWQPGEKIETTYTFRRTGSKSMYLRVSFRGYWKRIFHRNIATVTGFYGDIPVSDSDSAIFKYGNLLPEFDPSFYPEANKGFFSDFTPPSIEFPIINSDELQLTTSSASGDSVQQDLDNELAYSATTVICIGQTEKGICPVTGKDLADQYSELKMSHPYNDPLAVNVKNVLGPQDCSQFESFKINLGQNSFDLNKTYTFTINESNVSSSNPNSTFTVSIFTADGITFEFKNTNYQVHHVYAKGGSPNDGGGYFYQYYPTFPKGVHQDSGLSQPGGGWSHITFYYCVPPADPNIKIEKIVNNIDENGFLISGPPQFTFRVTNTGNVTLAEVSVIDNIIEPIYLKDLQNLTLTPGEIKEVTFTYKDWDVALETGNVLFELCDSNGHNLYDKSKWEYKDGYFYYMVPIISDDDVALCISAILDYAGPEYEGAQFILYSYFEVVQTTNGLVDVNWPKNPY